MNIIKKMTAKTADNTHNEGITLAFLGDSVTQGCFELYKKHDGTFETVFDKRYSYQMGVFKILNMLFPMVTVNMINAGISGDRSSRGLERIDRDVIRHQPDLTVVCYGLNDCGDSEETIEKYVFSLKGIFQKLKAAGSEIIFMTPNMMNTAVSPHLKDPDFITIAENCAKKQNGGIFDAHIHAAKELWREQNIPICDCYAIWKKLSENGVDITELLSNKINHPTREMNTLFAYELVKTMFSE